MLFFRYLLGFQLLFGALWCIYYTLYLMGFGFGILSFLILLPLLCKFIQNKYKNKLITILTIFVAFALIIIPVSLQKLWYSIMPHNSNQAISIMIFEKNLNEATNSCLNAYDSCFPKKPPQYFDQCGEIRNFQYKCQLAQNDVDKLSIPDGLTSEAFKLLTEANIDVKNNLKNWANFLGEYIKVCDGEKKPDAMAVKMELLQTYKNKFLADIKIKKVKTMLGVPE